MAEQASPRRRLYTPDLIKGLVIGIFLGTILGYHLGTGFLCFGVDSQSYSSTNENSRPKPGEAEDHIVDSSEESANSDDK